MTSATAGLLHKTMRETRGGVAVAAIALFVFATLLSFVLPQFKEGLSDFILDVPFLRAVISSSMGIDISSGLTTPMILSVVWTHPVMIVVTWAIGVALCTRFPVGEIDRGTIEVLLGWPVSRRMVYAVETIAALASGALLILCILAGYWLGLRALEAAERPAFGPVPLIAINMMCLYAAVGGLAFLVSALSQRRGRAFGVVFGILVVSYLLNFIAGIWPPAESVSFLSMMTYYQPADIIRRGSPEWIDIAVLLGSALVMWCTGMEVTARRSIATA